jgi:hypothetical protein
MGFRFRRSFRVFPGLKVNVSKSGVSESLGTRGAWFTVGPRGRRSTVGLPGTGMSYTEQHRGGGGEVGWILLLLVVVAVLAFVFAA